MNSQDAERNTMGDYLEAISVNREIEFIYNNIGYRFEPNYEKGGYDIWKYVDGFKTGGGKIIASAVTPEKLLYKEWFDGKSFVEIENEATRKYII